MDKTTQIYQAINAISKKINDINSRLDNAMIIKTNENKQGVADSQNATIELGMELDERLADIENALCELSEQ